MSPLEEAEALFPVAPLEPVLAVLDAPRPTEAEVRLLRRALQAPPAADAAATRPSEHQLGYWVPLLSAGLGHSAFYARWSGSAKGLRRLDAGTPIHPARLAAVLCSAADASEAAGALPCAQPPNSEPLCALAALEGPVPLHQVLSRLGAHAAARRSRRELASAVPATCRRVRGPAPENRAAQPTPHKLAALEWAGATWSAADSRGQTALHTLCAVEGQDLLGDSSCSAAPGALGRWLCSRWPAAVLQADGDGLTPLNYLTPPVCASQCLGLNSHRELGVAVAEGLERCLVKHPGAVVTELRQSEALRIAVAGLAEFAPDAPRARALLPLFQQLAEGGAWECALAEWRNGLLEAQDFFKEAADLQVRIRALRELAPRGPEPGAPEPAESSEQPGAAAAQGLSEEEAKELLQEASAAWRARQESFEDRIADLEAALGRPSKRAPPAASQQRTPEPAEALLSEAPRAHDPAPPAADPAPAPVVAADASDSAARAPSAEERSAEALVAHIRRLRLADADADADLPGVSPELAAHARCVRLSLLRAVERLAVDLYELESHFVYELLQNADDNRYAEESAEPPHLRLVLRCDEGDGHPEGYTGAYFFSVNNELGLRPDDVRAICDVNASSKAGKVGFTGNKGIGWKSCFQVSDCPHVLSGPFTFKFDVAGPLGKLGYVTPTWLGHEERSRLPRDVLEAHAAGNTVIFLPLRPGAAASVSIALEHMEEHHPCLLFMRRLRRLEMEYPDGRSAAYSRGGGGADVGGADGCDGGARQEVAVVRRDGDGEPRRESLVYLVHREALRLPGGGPDAWLTLAFRLGGGEPTGPTGGVGTADALEGPPLQALYCGPPVRRVGFRFAVNAPFDLVASRSDIHEGSAVNRAVCDALPAAFVHALEAHGSDLGAQALSFVGSEPPDAFWRRVRSRILACLHDASCVPVEDGLLAPPTECLLHPAGAVAAAASQLVPADLLLEACGKRFAGACAGSGTFGSLRGLGLEEFGLAHFRAVLLHRNERWPRGLAGDAAESGDGTGFFRPLFAWLDEVLRTSEEPGEVLERLWDLELVPSAVPSPEGRLLRLCDGPILSGFCGSLPAAWQQELCAAGALRVLDPAVEAALDGGARRFLSSLLVQEPSRALVAGLCVQWHLLRFAGASLHPAAPRALWASLACLMEVFHAGDLPRVPPSGGGGGAAPLLAALDLGQTLLSDWHEVGRALWVPAHGGLPPVGRSADLVCPTYLGVAAVDGAEAAALASAVTAAAGGSAAAAAAASALGLEPPQRLASLEYMAGQWGDPLRWEAFFAKLGMVPMKALLNSGAMAAAGSIISETLGAVLADGAWWQSCSEAPQVFDYVCKRIESASPAEREWLKGFPVPGGHVQEGPPTCLGGHFLHTAFSALGTRYLPYVRLPVAHNPEEAARLHRAASCLASLGVACAPSAPSLARCLRALRLDGCRDAGAFAEPARQLAQLVLEEGPTVLSAADKAILQEAVFVPSRGFLPAARCTWEDHGLVQWLAEVPALEAHYGRYGPTLRHFFLSLAGVSHSLDAFPPEVFLHALRRLVQQVDLAAAAHPPGSGDASQPAAAQSLLQDVGALATEIYSRLAVSVRPLPDAGRRAIGAELGKERLILLKVPGAGHPNRLSTEEAWWDVADDLREVARVTALSLNVHFGNTPGLQEFFLDVVGVRKELTREALGALLRRPTSGSELTAWGGLGPADVEELRLVQTTGDFRPVDWRPGGDESPPATPREATGDAVPSSRPTPGGTPAPAPSAPRFEPPRARHPRVPAWRTREAAEQERRAGLDATEAEQQARDRAAAAGSRAEPQPAPLQDIAATLAAAVAEAQQQHRARDRAAGRARVAGAEGARIQEVAPADARRPRTPAAPGGGPAAALGRAEAARPGSEAPAIAPGGTSGVGPASAAPPAPVLPTEQGAPMDADRPAQADSLACMETIQAMEGRIALLEQQQAAFVQESQQLRSRLLQARGEADRYQRVLRSICDRQLGPTQEGQMYGELRELLSELGISVPLPQEGGPVAAAAQAAREEGEQAGGGLDAGAQRPGGAPQRASAQRGGFSRALRSARTAG